MAETNFIPKIEYLKGSFTGTSAIGSDTITGIADTSDVVIGDPVAMFIEGTGVPAGTTIIAKTATTVQMSADATAAGSATFSFGKRIEFEYPPKKDPFGEDLQFKGKVTVAKSGNIQTITDYIEKRYNVTFGFVSQTIKEQLETDFILTHYLLGESFSYFDDKDESTTESVVEGDPGTKRIRFKVVARKGGGRNFLWECNLRFREVVG